ncbi:LacI family DNA-binding transcriptional regulator [Pseudonocardia yuanmonensis]|uniref:LacI family DNA-binding transcriptional regulator n=1 Tax=Pseudonocardia yuanmonensis TaxID=1095914 RepID=A0ABP8X342_9PSEU
MTGRRPTLKDVAARAGVSRATASLVIREERGPSEASRERVRAAAAELGYVPDPTAQVLRRRRSRLLGVVFTARDAFHADLLDGIYPAAEERGYTVVLGAVSPVRRQERAVEALLASRCEALVLLAGRYGSAELKGLAARLPVVDVGRVGDGSAHVDAVESADDEGVAAAVDHLVGLGHRAIVHVDGGDQPGADERRQGYRDAMRRHGLDVRVLPGDNTEVSGAAAVAELLPDLPTAILANNDQCAVGVLDALRRQGIDVPGRVSVVGYDDSQLSRLAHVDLTTVAQDSAEIARLAVGCVLERADGADADAVEPRRIRLRPRLVVRGTTGPPGE